MNKKYKDLLVGSDIGTSRVVAVVTGLRPDGAYEVIGMGQTESKGLKKDIAINIEAIVQSIQKALEEAELATDCKVGEVFMGITDGHIRSFNSSDMVAVKDKEITSTDVACVIEATKTVNIPADQQILRILTQESVIDGQGDVRKPIGINDIRLEVEVHIVTGAVSAIRNTVKYVRHCGLEVHDLTLQPLALSLAVLAEDEKEPGVVLVDIGSGMTDVAIFSEGAVRHMVVIPIAGDQITDDIAMALCTPTPDAEGIKIQYGIARQVLADPDKMINMPGVGDRGPCTFSRQALTAVIGPRVEELSLPVHQVMREFGYGEPLPSDVVFTGGTAMMPGMAELGEDMFLRPVRVGVPEYRGNLYEVAKSPRYTTVMGLLQEGRVQRMRGHKVAVQPGSARQIWARMKEWLIDNFRIRMCRALETCSLGESKLSFLF